MPSYAQVEISIASASNVTPPDGKPYTAYLVSCRLPLRTYTLSKRYSDFVALHEALVSQAPGKVAPPYHIPPKHWFASTLNNRALTEERRVGLEAYLQGILSDPDSRWRDTAACKAFLNLPASAQRGAGGDGRAAAARASLHASLTGPGRRDSVSDPTAWLDNHREAVGALQAARERLAARNSAAGARAAQEEGAAAKKQLVRAGTLIGALDRGLREDGNEGDFAATGTRLGEGEMRRRRDLVAAARREKERLEELQANIGRKENMDLALHGLDAEAGDASAAAAAAEGGQGGAGMAARLQPLQQSSSSGGGGGGGGRRALGKGRVIGKETARTRELENAGVLQLQLQLVKEQDADVDALAAAVRRQRQLAVEINEELEVQGEMLAMLDDDVGRLEGKVGVARKRVDKIS